MKSAAIFLIWLVSRFVRLVQGRACRFYPTCSEYSISAFKTYGFLKAVYLTIKRVGSCHPFSAGGYDPLIKKS